MSTSKKSAKDIFQAVVEFANPGERYAYLDGACGSDLALRHHVEALLKVHDEPDSLLDQERIRPKIAEQLKLGVMDATFDQPVPEKPGTQIGPYKLLQQIGEGGMGVVYMAEQTQPVKRRVALKIIKPGMDTKQVIARFEAERQALAMMDHPNIARVLDAGTTDSGRPYFVMELVKGVTITDFCDEHHLTPRERLELFLPVLQAVQHAHQKGIIHRDIKPSNVLVAEYDNQAVPKVIDFGVAKATNQLLTDKTMFTQYGQLIGTLEYMSPEQAKLNQMDIDTRSDIYSLGVLLYELLTGDTPFDRKRLRSAAFDEMMRIIREEEPPKPSMRLTTSATLASVSANRSTEPRKLSMLVRGELDWIVMKAMEKERSRRYETPNAFAEDIQRFLKQEAITARPASATYRLKKFTQRNRSIVMAGSLIAATLLLGFGISTWQAILANQERHAADQARLEAVNAKDRAEKAEAESETAREAESAERALAEQERDKAKALSLELMNEKTELSRQKEELRRAHYAASMNLIPAAWQADNVKQVVELLEVQKPKSDEEDLRGFEWHYWDRQSHPERSSRILGEGFTRTQETNARVNGYFSGDGQRFFSYRQEIREQNASVNIMHVLDTSTGVEVAKWDLLGVIPWGVVSINYDGTRVAWRPRNSSAEGGGSKVDLESEIWVFDAMSGDVIFKRTGAYGMRVAISRDGKRLAHEILRRDSTHDIAIWDLEDVNRDPVILKVEDHEGEVASLVFSPDATRLATAHRALSDMPKTELTIWDTATGQRRATLPMNGGIGALAFSPDGTRLAGISQNFRGTLGSNLPLPFYLWDGAAGTELKLRWTVPLEGLINFGATYNRPIFDPDGQRLLVYGDGSSARLIDIDTGATMHRFKSTENFVAAAFPPDGTRLLTVGSINDQPSSGIAGVDVPANRNLVLQEWDVPAVKLPQQGASRKASEQGIWNNHRTCQAYFAGHLLPPLGEGNNDPTTEEDRRKVTVRDSEGKVIRVFSQHSQPITSLRFSFDDRYVWSFAGSNSAGSNRPTTGPTESFVWEADTGVVRWSQKLTANPSQSWNRANFSRDGKWVALPEADDIRIVSTADWKPRFIIPRCVWVNISPDSRRLVSLFPPGTTDKIPSKIWDVETGKVITTIPKAMSCIFSSDGRWIAADARTHEINIWDATNGERRSTIKGNFGSKLVFSPDGSRLLVAESPSRIGITSGPQSPSVWDAATGKLLFRLKGIVNPTLWGIAFSPDGKRIATASMATPIEASSQMGAEVKIWDASSGREFLNLASPRNTVGIGADLAFTQDGHHLTLRQSPFNGLQIDAPLVIEETWDATPREQSVQP